MFSHLPDLAHHVVLEFEKKKPKITFIIAGTIF